MSTKSMQVGELARRTGLTIRTLHHYDEIGLLKPSAHTGSGYRHYTAGDVARLQQIVSLKQLGFSLEEVRRCLDERDYSPLHIIELQLARLREQLESQRKLCDRLESIASHFRASENVSTDEVIQLIEAMNDIERLSETIPQYYTPEQLEQLSQRAAAGGEEMQRQIQEAPQKWADLFTDVEAAVNAGMDPADPRAAAIAQRWLDLVSAFTGGDPGIVNSLKTMYQNEDKVMGMDTQAMRLKMEFIEKAAQAAGISHPS